jgi:hypothetical protein
MDEDDDDLIMAATLDVLVGELQRENEELRAQLGRVREGLAEAEDLVATLKARLAAVADGLVEMVTAEE